MESYPKWKYHATLPARIVQDAMEDVALGSDWYESPVDAAAAVATVPTEEPSGPVEAEPTKVVKIRSRK